jgi:N-acetylmuramoyl-L-alanine amidase
MLLKFRFSYRKTALLATLIVALFCYFSSGESSLAGTEAFTVCKGVPAFDDTGIPVAPLIILDPGHGGTDEGAKVQSMMEKRVALSTALMTKRQLETLGYRVILTRSRDIFLALPRRVAIANKSKGALFVSIHYNSSPNAIAKGIEIYYYEAKGEARTRASKRLANHILHQVLDQTEAHSRGVRRGNFYVVRETAMPAVLVEGGFMTNQDERSLLKDRKYLEKIAKGIAQGVHDYLSS